MLKVQFKEKSEKELHYQNLEIGDVFVNTFDDICIKTWSNKCLLFTGEKWIESESNAFSKVRPVKATLIVEE